MHIHTGRPGGVISGACPLSDVDVMMRRAKELPGPGEYDVPDTLVRLVCVFVFVCLSLSVCLCVCACLSECMRLCVCACVRVRVCVGVYGLGVCVRAPVRACVGVSLLLSLTGR
jgi:hypothetical protein